MKYLLNKYSLVFIIYLILVIPAQATTYYMRADGTAANKAAATSCSAAGTAMSVATHNSQTFSGDDVITLCDTGGTYVASIIAPSSGTSGHPIIYNNSGTPVIDFVINMTNAGWTDLGGGNYSHTSMAGIRLFWEDGIPITWASTTSLTDGNWNQSGGTIYYKPTSGTPASHTLTGIWIDNYAVPTPYGIDLRGRSNITVYGITFNRCAGGIGHGQTVGDGAATISGLTFHNNIFTKCYWGIMSHLVITGSVESNVSIYNNSFDYCNSGISAWTYSDSSVGHNQYHTGYTITGNTITNQWSLTASKVWNDGLQVPYYATDHEGISFQDVQNSTITGNTISNSFTKSFSDSQYWNRAFYIFLTSNGSTVTSGNTFARNFISGHYYPSIYVSTENLQTVAGFQNNTYAYNIITYSGADSNHITFDTFFGATNAVTGTNYFVNNTIYVATVGVSLDFSNAWSGNWIVRNNAFYSPNYIAINTNENTGKTIDHNLYYPNAATQGFQIGVNGMNYAQWQAAGYDTVGSLTSNPLFVNASGTYNVATDFQIPVTSPAVDTGVSVGLTRDYFNNVVPSNSIPDIGAHEYQYPNTGIGIGYGISGHGFTIY